MSRLLTTSILKIDSYGGLAAGVTVIAIHPWLANHYGVFESVMLFVGFVNLLYGTFGFANLRHFRRRLLFGILAAANILWGAACFSFLFSFSSSVSAFGLAHGILEGIYVMGLGLFEFRHFQEISESNGLR